MLIQTREQFVAARTALLQAHYIAVDTETTGLRFHMGHEIIGIATACDLPGQEDYRCLFYFPFRHKPKQMDLFTLSENLPLEWIQELKPVFERPDVELEFHNFKFDAKMLRKEGINITEDTKIWDTMVMSHMVNENGIHSLKGLSAERWGDHVRIEERKAKALVKKLGGYEKTSAAQMEPYACQDVHLTHDLKDELLDDLEAQELTPLWNSQEEEFLHCLLEMEWEGVLIDQEMADERSEVARRRMRVLEDEMGFDPGKKDVLAHKLFAAPPEGLGLIPGALNKTSSDEFPDGVPVMDADFLSRHLDQPLVVKVLEYRGLVKANSTWWKGYPEKADPQGRIHPEYSTAAGKEKFGTVTTRLSSHWPNVQQMPRDENTPVKKLLMPPPGYRMYEFDYAQIELREAACYADDELYIEAFRAGEDPHQATAEAVGVERQAAKHASYCILYGGAADTLQATLQRLQFQETGVFTEYPLERAEEILRLYYSVHPNLKTIAKKAEQTARHRGFVRLWTGRRRHFDPAEPWTHRKAFNSILQGGAAEILKHSMLQFHRMRPEYGHAFRMVIQVHDSLWFEVSNHFRDDWIELIKHTMEWPGRGAFPIPFPVDMKLIRTNPLEDLWTNCSPSTLEELLDGPGFEEDGSLSKWGRSLLEKDLAASLTSSTSPDGTTSDSTSLRTIEYALQQ